MKTNFKVYSGFPQDKTLNMINLISDEPNLVQFVRLWSANLPGLRNIRETVLIGFRPGYAMSRTLKLNPFGFMKNPTEQRRIPLETEPHRQNHNFSNFN